MPRPDLVLYSLRMVYTLLERYNSNRQQIFLAYNNRIHRQRISVRDLHSCVLELEHTKKPRQEELKLEYCWTRFASSTGYGTGHEQTPHKLKETAWVDSTTREILCQKNDGDPFLRKVVHHTDARMIGESRGLILR